VTLIGWLAVVGVSVMIAAFSTVTVLRRRRSGSDAGLAAPDAADPGLDLDLMLEEVEGGEPEEKEIVTTFFDLGPPARDRVGFTLYRPEEVKAGSVVPVLAYAHLAMEETLRPGQPPEVPAEVEEDVARHFRPTDRVQASTAEHTGRFAPSDALTFRLTVDGCRVSPSEAVVHWDPPFQSVRFDVTIPVTVPGPELMGRLVVYQGIFVRGTVEFSLRLGAAEGTGVPVRGRAFDKVFPSYSHRDAAIVDYVEEAARSLGHEFLRDVRKLRVGEVWSEEIRGYIEEADLFQLFWSSRSMASPYVRQEWEHALSLGRQGFILPVYWEDPLPSSPQEDLPPPALSRIHFYRLDMGPGAISPEGAAVVPIPQPASVPPSASRPEPGSSMPPVPGQSSPSVPPSSAEGGAPPLRPPGGTGEGGSPTLIQPPMTVRVPQEDPDSKAATKARSMPPSQREGVKRATRRFNPMVWMPAAAVLLLAIAVPVVMNPGGTASDPGPVEVDPVPVGPGVLRVGVPILPGDSLTPGDRERLIAAVRGILGDASGEIRLVPIPIRGMNSTDTDSLRSLASGLGVTHLVLPRQEDRDPVRFEMEEVATGRRIHR
jgi:hypothetical protein